MLYKDVEKSQSLVSTFLNDFTIKLKNSNYLACLESNLSPQTTKEENYRGYLMIMLYLCTVQHGLEKTNGNTAFGFSLRSLKLFLMNQNLL